MRIDFSQFHSMDHWICSAECFAQYGGPWNHFKLWWELRFVPWVYANTLCRFGRHYVVPYWKGEHVFEDDPPDGMCCLYCSELEEE